MNSAGIPPPTLSLRREAIACSQVSRPSGVRTISACGAPPDGAFSVSSGSFSPSRFPRGGLRGLVQHVDRGLVGGQHLLRRQGREHRLVEPGPPRAARRPGRRPYRPIQPGPGTPTEHAGTGRGTLRRHIPRSRPAAPLVSHRPVEHRASVQARRRIGERHRPAARAHQPWQRPLGDRPDDVHVDDLRPTAAPRPRRRPAPPCSGGNRAARPASFVSSGSGSLARPLPSCPGWPPLLRSLLRSRSDCCRARRASFAPIRSFELGVPESVLSIDRRRSSSASRSSSRRRSSRSAASFLTQYADLRVLRLHHSPQPRQQLTLLLTGHARLIGHEPQACST